MEHQPGRRLEELLDRIEAAASRPEIRVGEIIAAVGARSFAPILLLAGLVILAPVVGDIPGVPTLVGFVVILTAGQLLCGRAHVWLPNWLLARSVKGDRIHTAAAWMRRPAKAIDWATRPRLRWAVKHAATPLIAIICLLIASATPLMEFIPFSANIAGIAIVAFGLALLTEDGLIGLAAMLVSVAGFIFVIFAVT
jgi:hypothetical protein